jgi:hypothetical protein
MPATARRPKSEAYEKGIREGKAMAARSRGAEPPESEEEELEMDMEPGHSRKRSAKGAKHTKPATDGYGMKKPMDAECGCGGKKGGKCDGNCGSMRKRSDSLTPLEYLDACELGIQDRSTSYIRARLDTAETRADLKCGRGAISEGEKCTKGPAQKVQAQKPKSKKAQARRKALRNAVLTGAAVGVGLGALEMATYGQMRKKAAQNQLSQLKQAKTSANKTFVSQLNVIKRANENSPNNSRLQQASFRAAMQAKGYRDLKRKSVRAGLNQLKSQVPPSPARRRAARRGRRDSVWADGFTAGDFDI